MLITDNELQRSGDCLHHPCSSAILLSANDVNREASLLTGQLCSHTGGSIDCRISLIMVTREAFAGVCLPFSFQLCKGFGMGTDEAFMWIQVRHQSGPRRQAWHGKALVA